ncbi:MAG: isochorismate synthase [Halodesulfurarchaeum sp.]
MPAGDEQPSGRVTTPIWVRSRSVPSVSVGEAIDALEPVDAVWTGPGETSLVAGGVTERIGGTNERIGGVTERIVGSGPGRFRDVKREAIGLFDRLRSSDVPEVARPRLMGGFSFFDAEDLDPPWESFPPAMFVLPKWQLAFAEEDTWLTVTRANAKEAERMIESAVDRLDAIRTEDERQNVPGPGVNGNRPRVDEATWRNHVGEIVESIENGRLEKAVLAQALEVSLVRPFDLRPEFEALRDTYPDCYTFAFVPDASRNERTAEVFFGASPERLVSKTDDVVKTDAIAGTVPRGEDDTSDEKLSTVLQTDPKIHEEHGVVVDHIRDRLASVATGVSITDREVRTLENVQHLQSVLSATIDPATHVLDVLERLHPTPAVGGVPPPVAMDVIDRREPLDRGWYAAPIGWFDAEGNGTFAVGIRSALASGTDATLFAGNGIVRDSDPEAEFEEVQLKFRPILDHLQ